MTLPSHINTREKEKFIELNDGSVAVNSFDRGNIVGLITNSGLLNGVTYDQVTATKVSASTIDYKFYASAVLQATVRFIFTSDASWSLTKS